MYAFLDEYDDDREYNVANELTEAECSQGIAAITYQGMGAMNDDDDAYVFTYDWMGRLRTVDNQSAQPVAAYTYNGLGYRITWIDDSDADASLDDEPTFHFVYDEQWRIVAMYKEDGEDHDIIEQFVYHNAGNGGYGSASYIDDVILRDRDTTDPLDGTLDERVYYCQSWRHDVVALIDDSGAQVEQVRYSSYGIPFGLPAGDTDEDGDVDNTDLTTVSTWCGMSQYDVEGDLDLDGDIDVLDYLATSAASGTTLGRGVLSDVDSRKGYAGYEFDTALADAYRRPVQKPSARQAASPKEVASNGR